MKYLFCFFIFIYGNISSQNMKKYDIKKVNKILTLHSGENYFYDDSEFLYRAVLSNKTIFFTKLNTDSTFIDSFKVKITNSYYFIKATMEHLEGYLTNKTYKIYRTKYKK